MSEKCQLRTHATAAKCRRARAAVPATSRPIALVVLVVASEPEVNAANNACISEPLEARRVYRAVYLSTPARHASTRASSSSSTDYFQFDRRSFSARSEYRKVIGICIISRAARLARLIEARSLMLRAQPIGGHLRPPSTQRISNGKRTCALPRLVRNVGSPSLRWERAKADLQASST